MKKIVIVLALFIICACNSSKDNHSNDIFSFDVDMSVYTNLDNNYYHVFKGIDLEELSNIIDNKKSAIVLISDDQCGACQQIINEIGKKANYRDIIVYYLDIADIVKEIDSYERLLELLGQAVEEKDGEKVLTAPEMLNILDGEIIDYCFGSSEVLD